MPEPIYLKLAIPTPLRRHFEYLPPPSSEDFQWFPGQRLRVPFGRQVLTAILVEVLHETTIPPKQLKAAQACLDPSPALPADILHLCAWAAQYYQCPPGEVYSTALPALLRQGEQATLTGEPYYRLSTEGKGLPETGLKRAPKQAEVLALLRAHKQLSVMALKDSNVSSATLKSLETKGLLERFIEVPCADAPQREGFLAEIELQLNEEQEIAFEALQFDRYQSYLLEGTTGSGKTEVYLQAIARVLADGKQALVLIPEIGLTPQTLGRFQRRFNVPIAALHSGLNDKERLQAWLQASHGYARIIIGTRSAIFTPMTAPGIIIVDEEHDTSFKQQDGFRYSARDLAAVRANHHQIPLILGTATPALETLHNAISGRYQHLRLANRAAGAKAPSVKLLDIRGQRLQHGIADELLSAISDEVMAGNQVLVFLNRRGFAPTLMCHDCGWQALCPYCDTRLTVHQQPRHLHCHHCDHQRRIPGQCPSCHSLEVQALGMGTERSETELQALFPNTRIIRIDRDTTRRKNAMNDLLDEINTGKPCILVGTQMLAKGHHFPDVTLVAIIDADGGLFSADFRGPERMGQLITQVAGRAGRASKPGRVVLQSHHTDHPMIMSLMFEGYHRFARHLLRERQVANMPPYRYLALIKAEAQDAQLATQLLTYAREMAESIHTSSDTLQFLGPLPANMERRGGRFRFQLQINTNSRSILNKLLGEIGLKLENHPLNRKVRWAIDVDPQDMS